MNIRQITIGRCLDLQSASEYGYWKAAEAVTRGDYALAIAYQSRAAADSEGARSRLDRIVGIDPFVEQRI